MISAARASAGAWNQLVGPISLTLVEADMGEILYLVPKTDREALRRHGATAESALAEMAENLVLIEDPHSPTRYAVDCSDVFAIDQADTEPLPRSEVLALYLMWTVDRVWGAAVWACRQRGQMPHPSLARHIAMAGIWDLDEMFTPEATDP